MRPHLASFVADWQRLGRDTAVVSHRGNRARRTSYAELAGLAGRFAAELQRREISPGDRVLIWGANGPEWTGAFFGCLLRGVLAVPLDATGNASFAQRVAGEVRPKLVVGDRALLRQLDTSAPSILFEDFTESLPRTPDFTVDPAVGSQTAFQIVFTSGTTSQPKGIVHTHRNVLASLDTIEAEIGKYRRLERPFHPLRFLHTLPFSHVFGQFMGLWIPPLLGAELHLPSAIEPARLIALTRRERISVLVAVPRVLEFLRAHLLVRFPKLGEQLTASEGLRAWRRWWRFRRVHAALGFKFWAVICGGATLPPEVESFWNRLGLALIQGYGMTETAALVTLNHPFKVGQGTLGKALPGREVKLSEDGEIMVRGDMLAAGTWQNGTYLPRVEEWLATGDLAAQDRTGELRFLGRKGDVIVSAAGLNIYPQDLEAALLEQPGVRECAVVAYDGPHGPEPIAVVLLDNQHIALSAAVRAANARLSEFQQIRRVLRWPEPRFPYTTTGKLRRRAIREWARGHLHAAPDAQVQPGAEDALLNLVASITQERVEPDDGQRLGEDLHLDSLGRVQLQSALESQFSVEIGDETMEGVETLGHLRAVLEQGGTATHLGHRQTEEQSRTGQVDSASNVRLKPVDIRYPRWPWSPLIQAVRSAFLEVIAMPLVRLLSKRRVQADSGWEHAGPVLLVANHVNTYDVPLVLSALRGRVRRHTAVAMSAELLGDMRRGQGGGSTLANWLGRPAYWLLAAFFNVFPLPRSIGFRRSFAHAGEALDRGYSVLVFPEGRRSPTGDLQPFRPGIGLLAQISGVPVVPIALRGTGVQSSARRHWFRSGRVVVHVGAAMCFDSDAAPEDITLQLETAVRSMRPG